MNTLRAAIGTLANFLTGMFWAIGLGSFLGFALLMQSTGH